MPTSTRRQVAAERTGSQAGLATLDAMARMARQSGSVVHVVLKREPGVCSRAHAAAEAAGVEISVDLMAYSMRVRFNGAE